LDGTIPPEKQKYYLSVISKEIKRLSRLVTTLLHVSRIEAGKENPELNKTSFDLCEMTRLIIISFEERLLQKNVEFHLDAENYRSFVYADKDSIYQVMYNLLENAMKFVNEGGIIRVTITRSPVLENKKYHISVYNTGIGIRENDRKNIFDRFYKVDFSRNEDKSGVGLGLFIVKTKLDAHGETIAVSGEYGKYCEFDFSLQRSDSPHGELSRGDTDAITASPLISESRLPDSTHTDAQTSDAPSPVNDGQKADTDRNNPTDHTDNTEFTENTDHTNNTDNTDNTDNTERN
ncbi:MAG: sensor histidine kinase, partial [Eubacteriales bacterium]